MRTKVNGFTFIEVLAVLSIIAIASLGTLVLRDWAVGNARVSEAKNVITTLQAGAQMWKPASGEFTGISMTELSNIGAVPADWSDGVGKNPWGGDITIAVDVGDLNRYTINFDGITSQEEGNRLARDYQDQAYSSSFSTGTFTVTFQG
ncbi:type II secretion system protein [Idiomarina sp. UBA3162]|uniref:type II secretion system protein n=1 Tax=Idiomarina sp. UBA3162 TaxID=1946641 RepID=UPI000C95B57F|nr:prepilin-type N-terminal cleavage/methylation domain-containing protein [Idiomarina sp. UBA3162]MAD54836.1 prepilin-type cleavage/methylation domain-containing protein [Idiomarinaceae bacterium]